MSITSRLLNRYHNSRYVFLRLLRCRQNDAFRLLYDFSAYQFVLSGTAADPPIPAESYQRQSLRYALVGSELPLCYSSKLYGIAQSFDRNHGEG